MGQTGQIVDLEGYLDQDDVLVVQNKELFSFQLSSLPVFLGNEFFCIIAFMNTAPLNYLLTVSCFWR